MAVCGAESSPSRNERWEIWSANYIVRVRLLTWRQDFWVLHTATLLHTVAHCCTLRHDSIIPAFFHDFAVILASLRGGTHRGGPERLDRQLQSCTSWISWRTAVSLRHPSRRTSYWCESCVFGRNVFEAWQKRVAHASFQTSVTRRFRRWFPSCFSDPPRMLVYSFSSSSKQVQQEIAMPAEAPTDFAVGLHLSEKHGVVFMITKARQLEMTRFVWGAKPVPRPG